MPLDSDAESSRVHLLEDEEEQQNGDEQPEDQRNKRRRTDAGRFVVPLETVLIFSDFLLDQSSDFP
jgi:hypothetical protein